MRLWKIPLYAAVSVLSMSALLYTCRVFYWLWMMAGERTGWSKSDSHGALIITVLLSAVLAVYCLVIDEIGE